MPPLKEHGSGWMEVVAHTVIGGMTSLITEKIIKTVPSYQPSCMDFGMIGFVKRDETIFAKGQVLIVLERLIHQLIVKKV